MATLITQTPWTRQPQVPVRVVKGDPLWAFLPIVSSTSYVPLIGSRIRTAATASAAPSVNIANGLVGPVLGMTVSTGSIIIPPVTTLNSAFAATGAASLIVVGKSQGSAGHASGTTPIFKTQSAGSSFNHYPFTDGNIYVGPFSTVRYLNGTLSGATAGIYTPHVAIATAKSGSQAFYINGILQGSGSAAETPSIDTGSNSGFGEFGSVYFAAFFDRVLTASEISSFSSNPWQIFAPLPRRIWVGAAAAGGFTAVNRRSLGARVGSRSVY